MLNQVWPWAGKCNPLESMQRNLHRISILTKHHSLQHWQLSKFLLLAHPFSCRFTSLPLNDVQKSLLTRTKLFGCNISSLAVALRLQGHQRNVVMAAVASLPGQSACEVQSLLRHSCQRLGVDLLAQMRPFCLYFRAVGIGTSRQHGSLQPVHTIQFEPVRTGNRRKTQ